MSNSITAFFKGRTGVAESLYQYDYGMVLNISGLELPEVFEAHFQHTGDEETIAVIGMDNRLAIPDACLSLPGTVSVFIYTHDEDYSGRTEYIVNFRVLNRQRPADDIEETIDAARAIAEETVQPWVDAWLDEHPEATTTVQDDSLTTAKYKDASITTSKIEDEAITNSKVADEAITIEKIDPSAIDSTLTQEGYPADAKAVGDRFSNLLVDQLNLDVLEFAHFITENDYPSTQGMCVADGYLIVTRFKTDADPTIYYVIDIASKTVVGRYTYNTDHSNCLTYGNGYIYTAYSRTLYKIPFSDGIMGEMQTLTLPISVTALAYDHNENKMYFRAGGTGGTSRDIYESTGEDFANLSLLFSADVEMEDQTVQGLGFDGTYIFYPCSGSDYVERIFVFNKLGQIVKRYEIPRHMYSELEDVDFYNGNMFLNFNGVAYGGSVYCVSYLLSNESQAISSISGWKKNAYNRELATVYLDASNTVAFPDGSSDNPFNDMVSALRYLNAFGIAATIHVVAGTYGNVSLYQQNQTLTLDLETGVSITQLNVVRCTNVILIGSGTIGALRVEQGNCYLAGPIILQGSGSGAAISVYRGFITGYVGSIISYATAINCFQAVASITVSSSGTLDVTNVTGSNVNSIILFNSKLYGITIA